MADAQATNGDTAGGTGNGAPPERTFTQADVDRIIADRFKKIGDVEALKNQAAKAAEFEAEATRLREEMELAGKSEAEKAKARTEQIEKRYRAEVEARDRSIAEANAKATEYASKLRTRELTQQVSSALLEAKVYAPSLPDALQSMIANGDVETDDDHKIVAITVNGKRHASLKDAAEAFLATKPYFASAAIGAGGSGMRGGLPTGGGVPLHKLSNDELIEMSNRQRMGAR